MKPFGTLELHEFKGSSESVVSEEAAYSWHPPRRREWIVKGPEPATLLNRIIPDSFKMRRGVCVVSDTLASVEMLNWLMVLRPLTIDEAAKKYWEHRLEQLKEANERRETLEVLEPVEPNSTFTGQLRPFQKEGLDFLLKADGNCLLADEMGLGKGVTALSYFASCGDAYPAIIVAPLAVLHHWRKEVERFLRTDVDESSFLRSDRGGIVRMVRTGEKGRLRSSPITLINYDLLDKRVMDLKALNARTVVYDEIQYLRNTATKRYRAALELTENESLKHIIGLSGTPVYNKAEEIWPIANIITPGLLGTYTEFIAQHFDSLYGGRLAPKDPNALYDLLRRDFLLRRRKLDVLKDLPPKLLVKEHLEVDKEAYNFEVSKIFQQLDSQLKGAKTEFQKAAFRQSMIRQERQIAAVTKIPYVVKWVSACLESTDEPLVVYFHHRITRDALFRYLGDYQPAEIIGGQSDVARQAEIERFQKGITRIILVSIRAGALGINLSNASIVIFAELDWVPAVHKQAADRLHRIGQENRVLAYYLIADGTLDEKVAEVLVDKAEVIDGLLGDQPEQENTQAALRAFNELRSQPAFKDLPKLRTSPSPLIRIPAIEGDDGEDVGIEDVGVGDEIVIEERRTLRDKMQEILTMFAGLAELGEPRGVVEAPVLYESLSLKANMPTDESQRLVDQLVKEGILYAPKPGCLKKTSE